MLVELLLNGLKNAFFNIHIAFYFYSFGFICNFIIMFIVYLIENPNVEIINDDQSFFINMSNNNKNED